MMDIQILASGSAGNAYTVSDGKTRILLECGIPWKQMQKKSGFTMTGTDGCLITHEHGDHARAVTDVIRNGIDVCTAPGTALALGIEHSHRYRPVIAKAPFVLGTWQIMGLPVKHDAAEPMAYMLRSVETREILLFVTDAMYMPYGTHGITHLMMEANYDYRLMKSDDAPLNGRIMRNHMSIEAVEEWLSRADLSDLQKVWLLHLSDARSDEAEFIRRIQAATGAEVYAA